MKVMDHKSLLGSLEGLMRLPAGTLGGSEELERLKGWDSLAIMEYILLVDEMYEVDVPPDEVRKCKRVQDLLDLATACGAK